MNVRIPKQNIADYNLQTDVHSAFLILLVTKPDSTVAVTQL